MPVQSCTKDGKPGYACGPEGTCYTDSDRGAAWRKACAQCRAMGKPCEATSVRTVVKINDEKVLDTSE